MEFDFEIQRWIFYRIACQMRFYKSIECFQKFQRYWRIHILKTSSILDFEYRISASINSTRFGSMFDPVVVANCCVSAVVLSSSSSSSSVLLLSFSSASLSLSLKVRGFFNCFSRPFHISVVAAYGILRMCLMNRNA